MRSEVPCCVAPKGGPVFRDRNGRCGLLHNSHLEGFAARCALRAALRRARGRPRSPNALPRLREPRPFFWAAFLSLRRLRCGKKSRGSGLLMAAFVILNAAPLEKIRVPGFFSGYFSLPAAIRRERKVPAAPRGSRPMQQESGPAPRRKRKQRAGTARCFSFKCRFCFRKVPVLTGAG